MERRGQLTKIAAYTRRCDGEVEWATYLAESERMISTYQNSRDHSLRRRIMITRMDWSIRDCDTCWWTMVFAMQMKSRVVPASLSRLNGGMTDI